LLEKIPPDLPNLHCPGIARVRDPRSRQSGRFPQARVCRLFKNSTVLFDLLGNPNPKLFFPGLGLGLVFAKHTPSSARWMPDDRTPARESPRVSLPIVNLNAFNASIFRVWSDAKNSNGLHALTSLSRYAGVIMFFAHGSRSTAWPKSRTLEMTWSHRSDAYSFTPTTAVSIPTLRNIELSNKT
jgi:hypothetical protein